MQGLRRCSNDVVVSLELSPPNGSPPNGGESTETSIHRMISEHPVIIFSRSSCCMCHAMKKLLVAVGVHPTVIELDDREISALPPPPPHSSTNGGGNNTQRSLAPAVFIGGTCVGGLDSLVALHISGLLVPRLVEVGALRVTNHHY